MEIIPNRNFYAILWLEIKMIYILTNRKFFIQQFFWSSRVFQFKCKNQYVGHTHHSLALRYNRRNFKQQSYIHYETLLCELWSYHQFFLVIVYNFSHQIKCFVFWMHTCTKKHFIKSVPQIICEKGIKYSRLLILC